MQKIRRITIHDVARKSGVGTTTVSRVLNGGKLVAPAVRAHVESVIRELDYQPSQAARALAQEKSRTIGLIVPRLTDPFFSTIAHVAQAVCKANDHTLMISTSEDLAEQTFAELSVFAQHRVDGLLIVPPIKQTPQILQYCRRLGHRVVALDLPIEHNSISCVQTNNEEATGSAVHHLIQHGCKRILFLESDPHLHTIHARRKGYEKAMRSAKLKPIVRSHISSLEDAEAAILAEINGRSAIDGIVTANSTLCVHAFQAMQKNRISIPSRLRFITFDDFTLADTLRPSVTCIAQPVRELSRIAMELLLSQMQSPNLKPQRIQLPSKLVLRQSCGCLKS